MNKLTWLIIILVSCSLTVMAQEKRDTIHRSSPPSAKAQMRDELGLSKEQAKKLKAVNQDFRSRRQTIENDTALTKSERREKSRGLAKDREAEINKILTPEQQKKFHDIRRQRLEKQQEE